jgi:hypothetical protein
MNSTIASALRAILLAGILHVRLCAQFAPNADSFLMTSTIMQTGDVANIGPGRSLYMGGLGFGFLSKIQGAGDSLAYARMLYGVGSENVELNLDTWSHRTVSTCSTGYLGRNWGVASEDHLYMSASHPGNGVSYLARIRRDQIGTVQDPELLGLWAGWDSTVSDATTNGRDIIFATNTGIYVLDTEMPFHMRQIDPLRASAVAIGRDGWVMIGRWEYPGPNGIRMIHPRTGATRLLVNAPPGTSGGFAGSFGYNPWTDEFVHGGYGIVWGLASDRSTWNTLIWNMYDPNGIPYATSNAERPFLLLGRGCLNGLGKKPRLGWQGLPLRGQSYDITLMDAEPNTMMAFWFGYSRTWSPTFGSLPFDAGIFGAPGCRILASPDVCLLAPVDAQGNGAITLPVPMSPAIAGLKLFGQTGSFSTANPLGVATSESVIMRYR